MRCSCSKYAPTDHRSSHAARAFCYSWLRQLLLDLSGLVGVLFFGLRHQRMCLRCLNLKPIHLLLCPPWNGCGIVSTVIALGGVCQYVFSTLRSTQVPTLRKSALHCTALHCLAHVTASVWLRSDRCAGSANAPRNISATATSAAQSSSTHPPCTSDCVLQCPNAGRAECARRRVPLQRARAPTAVPPRGWRMRLRL